MRLSAVGKRFGGGRPVLIDVDLELARGDVVAVTGGNGSGKSTLLRMLVGLSRPTTGSISGRPGTVGYVPDRFPPNERLSALSYLTHMGSIRGLSRKAASGRANELLERLSLHGGVATPVRLLSKGNAQKVAVAQALLVRPELLVLDEPWSGLDVSAHDVLADILRELGEDGGTVVFTDHRESVKRMTASRTYEINGGQVALRSEGQAATSTVVLSAPSSRAAEDWSGSDGVLRAIPGDDTGTLHVSEDRTDAVLLMALTGGWSVRNVRRSSELDGGSW